MLTRRRFLHSAALTAAATRLPAPASAQSTSTFAGAAPTPLLAEYPYSAISLAPETLAEKQFRATQATLRGLDEDGLLKPYRLRTGLPSPGPNLGGWYDYAEPSEKSNDHGGGYGFCPGHTFGQWLSSFSRAYAADRDPAVRAKIVRLLDQYSPTINPAFYKNFRFPAYVYEKLNVGLLDAYRYAEIPEAKDLFARTRAAALPHLPTRPLNRDEQRAWREAQQERTTGDFLYDESYTIPENLFHATHAGMGDYRSMARQYLLDKTWFDPLSRNENVLDGKHAYSYCNSLNSAIQAHLDGGDPKYLKAAVNGFRMFTEQSFATGGWGPQEGLDHANGNRLYTSLSTMAASFETPCGAYANFKVTRGLMRITGAASYGDFMERTLYNTILGALPLQPDGRSFYYANFSNHGKKAYHEDAWPCCSGTIGQVTADYRISTYLHDDHGPFVNLYIPSTLKFTTPSGPEAKLVQLEHGPATYPFGPTVRMRLETTRPTTFALRLRIPAFSKTATIHVNGHPVQFTAANGWATLNRRWHSGDRIELTLDMQPRLEPIDPRHPETVALLYGPLVLFPMGHDLPSQSRQTLLAVTQSTPGTFTAGPLTFKPFQSIQDEPYQTYLQLS